MGAVEAISLSILVGSSVDYCVHLVEGYLLAGESLPPHQAEVSPWAVLPCPSAAESTKDSQTPPRPTPVTECPRCVVSRSDLPGDSVPQRPPRAALWALVGPLPQPP